VVADLLRQYDYQLKFTPGRDNVVANLLRQYDYQLKFTPGRDNMVADLLSCSYPDCLAR
jgi:hypothetical protein